MIALELDLLVEFRESVNAFLQTLGDRQVPKLDYIAQVELGRRLRHQQQVVGFAVHEVAVALEVSLVHVEAAGHAEEAFEL